jgi:hypothetical protein
MSLSAIETGSAPAQWLQGLWEYYREYTHTAIHAASAAALTIFGLLVFIDPLFVVLAITSYLGPPIFLYSIGADAGNTSDPSKETTSRANSRANSDPDSDSDDRDSDSDSDDGDADSDGADGDADVDGLDADSDTDG